MPETPTHMRNEILEIPAAAARLIEASDGALALAGRQLRDLSPKVIATVARGSSDHAASFLKYATELTTGVPVASLGPSIASIYRAKLKLEGAACLTISQSGKSPDIVAMAEAAKSGGALTIALTNTAGSPLANASDHAIDILAGVEKSVAATKSFVNSAVAGLLLLAHWTGDTTLLAALRGLPEHLRKAIDCDWMGIADALTGETSLFILGRGPSAAIANEAALKFKETCGMHAEAYSAAEVMHGPMALVGPGFPVVALAARDASEPATAEAADLLAGKGASVFVTSAQARKASVLPFAPTGHPITDPLPLVVSFYAFVEAFARKLGLDPDQPRNLRKVTETV
ncbi:SIS domain-containing protein [Mesorhizobium sp. VNQ89]|uniref:SIS domain-containing protein n=1 Tax=Mesorhizobium quangtriensis TaxID=3157709 RepID=UPI0032B81770